MNNKDEIIKNLQIKNGKLQIQIERLKLDKEEYYLDYLNLQQRIDKAENKLNNFNVMFTEPEHKLLEKRLFRQLEEIRNILRGEDNEK